MTTKSVAVDIPNIELAVDSAQIKKNREALRLARAKADSVVRQIQALERANSAMCPHTNSRPYNDPRDPGGWDCLDCGASQ